MKKIAFIHPDLGIGGAERLIVDAAVGLQELGYSVVLYTSHCDKSHCFEEISNGTLEVKVYGDFLPRSFANRFYIVFAILRQLYLTFKLLLTGEIKEYDFFIFDLLSFSVPFVNALGKGTSRILFYCHFPDQLLAKKGGFIKLLYRIPFDYLEETTTGYSDKIVVNSKFTKSVFDKTFKVLRKSNPGVIYPCFDPQSIEPTPERADAEKEIGDFFKGIPFFVSVNRFEKKKNVELAIKSFAEFKKKLNKDQKAILVVAGGYDPRVNENVEYLKELCKLCDSYQLKNFTIRGKLIILPPSTEVLFMPSISSHIKNALIKKSELLLYTPSYEHFGIVPVEGMLLKTPVLAVNNGGPLESIVHYDGKNKDSATGYNVEPDSVKWSQVLLDYFNYDDELKLQLGKNGHERAVSMFLRTEMSKAFDKYLTEASTEKKKNGSFIKVLYILHILILLGGIYLYRAFF